MTIRAELADGRVLEFPDGTDPNVIQTTVKRMISESPVQTGGAPQEGITAALTGGFKRFLSTGETAAESLINPELAAQRGAERSRQIGEQYAPGASLEKVKQAYESEGLFPAIKEGISQIPAALAEQAPQIASTLGSARLGAMAGSPFGPLGAVVGGVAGATLPSLVQLYGSNLERQFEEKAPISRAGAFGAAVPGAALEVASQFIPMGRSLVGKLLGPKADEFLKKGSEEAIERAARESLTASLTKGAGVGALAEIPTEVAQQMLERYQAGLSLTGEDALKEYGEAAYGAGLVGGPFGAGARALGRPGARAEFERQQKEEEARLAVSDEELAQRFPDVLPGGLRIEEQEIGREMAPAGYSILAEGREEPLSVVDTAEEAQAKLESLTQIREQERAKLLEEDQKIDADVQKAQARLEQLEATEQSGTEEYKALKAGMPATMEEEAQKKAELYDRIQKLGAPLSVTPFGEVERVNKQYNVVTPSGSVMQSFATQGEAEADVRKMFGEEAFDLKKKNIETARQLYKTFVPQMRKFGLEDVGLKIVDRIENGAGGSYLNKLITTSLEEENPIQTMRHESLHAMKDLGFFTPQQWRALEERANKEWINKYLKGQAFVDEQGNQVVKDGKNVTRYDAYVDMFTKEAEQKGLSGKQLDQYVNEAIVEETVADAFGDYDKGAKPPPGLIAALFRKIKNFFSSLGQALRGAGFQSAEDIFQGIEQGKLKPAKAKTTVAQKAAEAKPAEEVEQTKEEKLSISKPSEWKATKADIKEADEYFNENGIMPYTSEGQIDVPLEKIGVKYSIKKPYDQKAMAKDQTLKNDPLTGLPMNANGTVTLYFPTDNAGARDLAKTKRLKGATPEANRVYLTNESSAAAVQAKPGMIDQPLGGANVLLQVDPSLLHVLEEYEDGRKDFFIPIAEGEYFSKKMAQTKMFTLNAPRTKGLHPDRTLSQVTKMVNDTADKWASASKKERAEMAKEAKAILRDQHNIEKLFGANSKLEKTNIGDYGLTYNGKKVMSTGLGFASAQKINDEQRATTCPQSAICESLCLGETSGQNLLYGGEGEFRSGPRLSQFLKTEALVVNPEAFSIMLIKQIENFRNAAKKLGYQPAIRLNVTSDFNPKTFENIIKMFPDVMFYDYTKLDTKPIAPNHHLTYSSTGASQIVNGEVVFNKESNWDRMVDKVLSNGKNVAMAFASRNDMPKAIFDERTGKTFQVWNGDEYDARFLDPIQESGQGWIIGLTNKDNTTKPEDAAKKHNGFFLDYDAKRDGDTLVIRDQTKLKADAEGRPTGKVIPIAKLSLAKPSSPAFKQWFGKSTVVNADGTPKVMYHGLAKDTTDFTRKTARGAPIFLTDDPTFAERFAADSYDSVSAHPEKYLSKEQIADGVKKAIAAIRKDYGKDSLGKEMIESLKTGDLNDATPEAQEYIKKEFVNMLPAGPHIMPLYVRAENPFDYQNPRHIYRLKEEVELDDEVWNAVKSGDWDAIESGEVQDAIKMAGFDSFYVKEHGRKNLAVYEPTQVKSATGNVGTYDLKNPDVRYSLRGVAFPTVEEAKDAAAKEPVPDTPEFKRYIAGSQWLDENGKAKKFFHATPFDFFDFKDGVIYLSETAEESEPWGRMAEDRLRGEAYKALNKDEKMPFFQQAVDEAVSKGKMTEEEGKEFMRDVKRRVPDFGDYKAIKKEMDDVLLSLSPNRMKIMPVYARAVNPFDFRNKEHVEQVVNYITSHVEIDRKVSDQVKEINKLIGGAPTTNTENILNGLSGNLSQGYASFIEKPEVQRAIRRLFDGYNVRRNRTAPISYAVFKPNHLKSITGNDGQFNLETKDIRYSLSKVRYSDDRFEKLWSDSTYNNDTTTNGYMAFVDPADFVKATSTPGEFDRVVSEKEPVDFAKMRGLENVPTMVVSKSGDNWKIIDHQGRHRMWALHEAGYRDVPVLIKFGSGVEDAKAIPVKAIRGQTGAINDIVMVAEAEPLSYANKDKAMEKFTRLESKVKYSLPSLSAATQNRLNEVTPQRYEPTFKDRVIGTFKQDYTSLRQKFLNRYEALAVLDRRLREQMRQSGGPALLADQSAEFAALQSDLAAGVTASAMGIGDRQGGIPVYKNGFTTIDTSVKGLTEALAPLAKYGDPEIYQRYQFWAGWKRGRRLLREGREQVYTPADAKLAQEIEAKHPEFVQVQKDLVAFNNGIVNFAVQTGVLSRERAQVYTKYADYIPFYRQLDLDKTIGPNPFSGISGLRGPKELKGGEAPLGDFMENLVRNTQSMINAGMKNAAAQKATKVALQLKEVERLPGPAKGVGYDVYTQLENGELVYYRSADPLFIDALKSLNMPDLPFMGLLSAPANVLRNLVTKDPGFMMANLLRDSLSSYVTSGQNVTPIVGTMVNFGKALSGKDKNLQALFNAGVIGGYEFSQNVEQSGKSLSADLNKKAGKDAILLRPFKSLWEGLEKGTTASDAATRMAVYERVMKETGNEAEAISRALEVMNFNRKGNSILIRIATAAIPFFNARLQGLDLFYRASTGRMDTQDAQEIKRKFWVRGMTMASLSVMYYMSVAGDDEYEKQEEETKDNNWIFPSLGIRVPIPFEVGTLFKTMPERITAYLMGNDTGKELKESTLRALGNTFAFNPIPQTFKPIIEVATNYNFFTMRPIVGQGMQDVAPQFQVGPGTSKTAEYLGGLLNVSPLKLDQLIKGYTGTIGGYVTDVVDAMVSEFSDVPKASKRFEQMPIVKRFALDPEARGSVTQFYELQKSVDTFVRTANLLEKTARPEEYAKYVQENLDMLAAKDYISGVEKGMKELREMKRMINTLDIPPDEKRDLLVDLGRAENNLTANTKTIKKAFSELK